VKKKSRSSGKMQSLLKKCFKHQLEIKLLHFQTESYAAHKSLDVYLAAYLLKLDQLFEILQGQQHKLDITKLNLEIVAPTDRTIGKVLKNFAAMLESEPLEGQAHELAVEMAGDAEQLIYLLSFK
jgi:hypothetical protein